VIPELVDNWDPQTPIYDALMADSEFDPFATEVWYELHPGVVGDYCDALDRSEPEPWWPGDLRSVAHLIASRMGVEYTGFSAEHQEELRRRLDAECVVTALHGPTLLGLEAVG